MENCLFLLDGGVLDHPVSSAADGLVAANALHVGLGHDLFQRLLELVGTLLHLGGHLLIGGDEVLLLCHLQQSHPGAGVVLRSLVNVCGKGLAGLVHLGQVVVQADALHLELLLDVLHLALVGALHQDAGDLALRGVGQLSQDLILGAVQGAGVLAIVDLLADLKQKYWQVLPVGPTSFGDSPYQSLSAFAGNPYLIDLDQLAREKLLTPEEIRSHYWGTQKSAIDYAALFENRTLVLQKAFGRFDEHEPEFQQFVEENRDWVEDYGLYMALKVSNGNQNWQSWPENIQKTQPVALAKCRKEMYNNIMFWVFCQYKFFQQWGKLREYANSKGVQLIGDVPFYVGKDSVDTWMHPEQFLLDENGEAAYVAAAIPDKFSETGQVWGNPLYNWPLMQEDGFSWWKRRMQISTKLFDVIRMDHFIGFVKNYMVPKDATDASGGRWMKGPGRKLTDALNSVLNGTTVIADDYGGKALIPGVKKLLAKTGWLDTKVLMFAFDGDPSNEHLPHNYPGSHTVVYAGTHDNDTIVGYFRDKTEYELAYLYEYLNISSQEEIPDALIRCAYASIADIAIIQMQDLLKLGNEARMNAPSTVGYNWRWRLNKEQLAESRRAWIRNLAAVYRR